MPRRASVAALADAATLAGDDRTGRRCRSRQRIGSSRRERAARAGCDHAEPGDEPDELHGTGDVRTTVRTGRSTFVPQTALRNGRINLTVGDVRGSSLKPRS